MLILIKVNLKHIQKVIQQFDLTITADAIELMLRNIKPSGR